MAKCEAASLFAFRRLDRRPFSMPCCTEQILLSPVYLIGRFASGINIRGKTHLKPESVNVIIQWLTRGFRDSKIR